MFIVAAMQVKWHAMVPNRSAAQAERRWRLMCKCIPGYWNMSFPEIVHNLTQTFAPGLLMQESQQ